MATRDAHTLCVTEDGRVWGWGNGGEGQLGAEVIKADVRRAEEDALSRQRVITGNEKKVEAAICLFVFH